MNQLQDCLSLAQDPALHQAANEAFTQLRQTLEADADVTEVLEALWSEVLSARRSAAFWQQLSNVEKEMSDRLAQNHVQLQQNYLRLMQEQ